jgi:hypothetical protein
LISAWGVIDWAMSERGLRAGSGTAPILVSAKMGLSPFATENVPLTQKSRQARWMFSADGYAVSSSNPVYLSFKVDPDDLLDGLEVWHYDGTSGWAKHNAFDLTHDGTYASFTATSFSGYAMLPVPEPGTLMLVVVGLLGVLIRVRMIKGGW